MKLEPRERRVRSDYLLDNAAALKIGHLFLNWGKKKSSKSKSKTKKAKKAEKAEKVEKAPKAPNAPKAPKAPKPAKKVTVVAKKATAKKSTREPAKKAASAKAKAKPSPKAAPAKVAPAKTAAASRLSRRKYAPPSSTSAAAKRDVSPPHSGKAGLPSAPIPATRAKSPKPAQAPAPPAAKKAVVRRPRRPAAPPVIPNPVPTPALPHYSPSDPVETVDSSQMVTITVRTMNGSSFRLVLTLDTTLYDLKRQILGVIAPGPPSPHTFQRLPMLVLNGRPLMPDNATLRALRFSALSTVYCFPEPS